MSVEGKHSACHCQPLTVTKLTSSSVNIVQPIVSERIMCLPQPSSGHCRSCNRKVVCPSV